MNPGDLLPKREEKMAGQLDWGEGAWERDSFERREETWVWGDRRWENQNSETRIERGAPWGIVV